MGLRWQCSARSCCSQVLFTPSRKRSQVCSAAPRRDEETLKGPNSGNDSISSESEGSSKPNNKADQQQTSWGSSWKRRPMGSGSRAPASYFQKQSTADVNQNKQHSRRISDEDAQGRTDDRQPDPQLEASIRQNIDQAAETLQEIITEVLNEMLVEEASSYVMDEQGPALQINQVGIAQTVSVCLWYSAAEAQ